MRGDVPALSLGEALCAFVLFVAVALLMVRFLPDDAPPRVAPAVPGEPNFSRCFESVVPRAQFICRDGTIWTRTLDGWSVDEPSSAPRVPAG